MQIPATEVPSVHGSDTARAAFLRVDRVRTRKYLNIAYLEWSNNKPMRTLGYKSPKQVLKEKLST